MAGEEAVSTVATGAQKAMEISTELIKLLAPLIPKLFKGALGATRTIEDKVTGHKAGSVSRKELLLSASKAKSSILSDSNFLSQDAEKIAAKAKQYGIPVSIIGEGEKATLSYLDRDKAVVGQILQETISERMQATPQDVKHFAVEQGSVEALKLQFEKNGIECCFVQSANGKIFCQYPAKDKEKVAIIKQDFKAVRNDIAESFKVEPSKSGLGIITDLKSGRAIDLTEYGGNIRRYQAVNLLQKEFGYSKDKAILAAHKLCDDLRLDPKEYFAHTEQIDALKNMQSNIRYRSDSILLRDTTFNSVHFADGEHTHIIVTNGDKSAALSPATMSREEMKNICVSELEMTEEQANEAVEKTVKINTQINSKLRESTIFRNTGEAQTVEINRTSNNSFSVKLGTTVRNYNFNDDKLTEKIGKDFGITAGKAQSFINKAQKQSAFQNSISSAAKAAKDKAASVTKNLKENIGKRNGAI